jgi:hypothetical protein
MARQTQKPKPLPRKPDPTTDRRTPSGRELPY